MTKRKIIKIDEEKCNGCGECIPNCREGAILIMDGKARLKEEALCDGLGACLGHCPQGAITIEERDAEAFDEGKVMSAHAHGPDSCPGVKIMDFRHVEPREAQKSADIHSQLRQWPVQLKLVPASAPYLNNADLLIAADCVPFAYGNFHQELLKGKVLLVGCPKLDDTQAYQEKIAQILKSNTIKSVTYAHMEVPCCFGLVPVITSAIQASGKDIPFKEAVISIQGERLQ